MRWALWAAKESAYKVAPGGETEASDPFLAEVDHPLGRFQVCLEGTDEWVHAVASVSGAGVAKANWQLRSMGREAASRIPGLEASVRVRRLARSALASALSAVPSDIVIAAAAKRVPRVTWRGQSLPVDLSFSHHGRFVACAWGRISRTGSSF